MIEIFEKVQKDIDLESTPNDILIMHSLWN